MGIQNIKSLNGTETSIDNAVVEAFQAGLRGTIVTQDSDDYDSIRSLWNGLIDKRPTLIVRCSGAGDVVDTVNFAREHGLLVAVRGGGHNVAGNAMCDGGLVIDLSEMNSVHVNPTLRRARVGGGALLGDVDRETQAFGLAAPFGVVSLTGVAGLTLCGGIGWLRRKHGMACDALVSVDIVTADGRLITASETENAELFWGVRGGGGNFGVVTSFEFELFPVGPMVTFCAPFYRLDKNATDIMRDWRDFMDKAPEDISSQCLFWSIPPIPQFPEELHGTPVVVTPAVHSGSLEEGERLTQPLRELGEPILDLSGPAPYAMVQTAFDPVFEKGARRNYWKSLYVDTCSDDVIDMVVSRALNRPDQWSLIAFWHLGGAMNRVDPSATALGERKANFLYSLDIAWTDPSGDEAAIAWTRDAWQEMMPHSRGGSYLNFPGQGEEGQALLRASYGNDNYNRLVKLKRKFDPDNLFRLNQNIET